MKYGLLIQGPRFSHGNGPNKYKSENGFDSLETVRENVRRFREKVDIIILSTWHKSGFENINFGSKITLLESYPPIGFDYLNQKKQFLSMFAGASYISCNSSCTHVIKIRTDQLLPIEFIEWLDTFFTAEATDTKKIICSEFLRNKPFYVGDFVFAGTIEQIKCFTTHVLKYNDQRLVLNNSVDYVIKHLIESDKRIKKNFYKNNILFNELLLFSGRGKSVNLWLDISKDYFSVLPEEIYWQILWRGRPMTDVFANNHQAFIHSKECRMLNNRVDGKKLYDGVGVNFITQFKQVFLEFKRYLKAWIKFQI